MKIRISEKLMNKKGSSLAYVLIIGMIIMIMVASLLAVANSDLTFTQETLESRQAYIDAKSVIEFGKIQINKTLDVFKGANQPDKNNAGSEISYYILGNRTTSTNPLNLTLIEASVATNEQKNTALGIITKNWEKTVKTVTTSETINATRYTFKIETQNLRRKLDYKVDFNYVVKITNNAPYVPPVAPATDTSEWLRTDIKATPSKLDCTIKNENGSDKFTFNGSNVLEVPVDLSLNIGRDKNNDKFDWKDGKTLNLTAKNICVTPNMPNPGVVFNMTASEELRFKSDYTQNNGNSNGTGKINTLTARDVIFDKNIVIGDNAILKINCDSLWVGGSITLGSGSQLIVAGTAGKATNQMIVGPIISNNDGKINISNLFAFTCNGLEVTNGSFLVLNSNIIQINGNLTLDALGSNSNEFKTEYFDSTGKTTISNSGSSLMPVKFTPIQNKLNIRFEGGYEQFDSNIKISSADKVIFGGTFRFHNDGLSVQSDQIYFDGDIVYIEDESQFSHHGDRNHFTYAGKTNAYTNVNVKSSIYPSYREMDYWNHYVWYYEPFKIFAGPGMYTGTNVKGTMPDGLINPGKPYIAPTWPAAPVFPGSGGSGQGTEVIDIPKENVITQYY